MVWKLQVLLCINNFNMKERLIMESNKDYQRDDMIFEIVVWLFVIAVIFMDIKATF